MRWRKTLIMLAVVSLTASLIACSKNYVNFDTEPSIKIPNLPPSVKYTDPKIPDKPAKDAKETAEVLKEYEDANAKNKLAIEQARKHNKGLQRIYNTKK